MIKKYLTLILISTIIMLMGWNFKLSGWGMVNAMKPTSKLKLLETENKKLKNSNSKLENSNKSLRKNNKSFKKHNNKLLAQKKAFKKQFLTYRENYTKSLVGRAKKKIASAPAKAVPFIGTAAIVGLTVYEVNLACQDMNDLDKLEKDMFGENSDIDTSLKAERKAVCELDIENGLMPLVEKQYDKSINWVQEKSQNSQDWISETSKDSKEWVKDISKDSYSWLNEKLGF